MIYVAELDNFRDDSLVVVKRHIETTWLYNRYSEMFKQNFQSKNKIHAVKDERNVSYCEASENRYGTISFTKQKRLV